MKSAIWGAGGIAHTHAEALKASGIEISAIVDINEIAAKDFAEKWQIPNYGTDPSILYTEDISTVHVCTPPNLHYEMVLSLLEHKKNVLCEKPLCFQNEQAQTLAKKAKEYGLICAINLNVRFHMACQKAKQVVQSTEFGPVRLIHGNYMQEFHALPAPLNWRYNPELAGPMRAVTEIGTHWMDIAQYISGKKVVAVSALFGNFNPTRYVEDHMMYTDSESENRKPISVLSEDAAAVNIRFEDGAIGTVLLSEVSQGRMNRITLEVTGEKSNLWWNAEDNNILNTAAKGSGVNTEIFAFGNGFMDTFRSLISHYYEAIKSGKLPDSPMYPTFDDKENIVKLCNAMLESANNDSKWTVI